METTMILYAALCAAALNYLILIPVFHFILSERVKLIETIIMSRRPRERPELERVKVNAKKDVILSFFWPCLLIRGQRHVIKKKR